MKCRGPKPKCDYTPKSRSDDISDFRKARNAFLRHGNVLLLQLSARPGVDLSELGQGIMTMIPATGHSGLDMPATPQILECSGQRLRSLELSPITAF